MFSFPFNTRGRGRRPRPAPGCVEGRAGPSVKGEARVRESLTPPTRQPGRACAEPAGRVVVGWEMAAAGLVAMSAAADYAGPGASGGNLPGVPCGPSSGTCPGPGPGSWSRSLDRALEEAAVTGVLSLSGRKLREFPRGAANHDLTDTTRAGERGPGRHSCRRRPWARPEPPGRWGEGSRVVTGTRPRAWGAADAGISGGTRRGLMGGGGFSSPGKFGAKPRVLQAPADLGV